MSQKAFGAENINDVMKVRMRAVMGAGGGGESGGCCCYRTPPEALVELCCAPQGGSPADVEPSS